MEHLLSWITFIPLLGALVLLAIPSRQHQTIRWISVAATALSLILATYLLVVFDRGQGVSSLPSVPNGFPLFISTISWAWTESASPWSF